jgi:HK97 family phage major capsid protein
MGAEYATLNRPRPPEVVAKLKAHDEARAVSPRVKPSCSTIAKRSSYAEFRAAKHDPAWLALDVDPVYQGHAGVFWKYLTAPVNQVNDPRLFLSEQDQRVLSKASGSVGGYLVPSDFEQEIMSVAYARASTGQLARTITTPSGVAQSVGLSSAHGVATWTAESASVTASDETFSQVTLNAFKATTAVIVSEELIADAAGDVARLFLAEELGARIAQLEGAAYATGDGTGKPLGVVANVGTTITMATGNATTFAYTSLVDAVHTVAAGYRTPEQNPAWIVSDARLKALRKIAEATTSAPLLTDVGADQPRLLG